jgi:predicted ATPase/DNA-binding SARP family transcriptional activator
MAGVVVSAAKTVDDVGVPGPWFPAEGADQVVALELRILGPVQAVREGRDVPLGGPKQRAVLALLLMDAGRAVLAGQLAEALWQGSPPSGAAKTLRSYISRLRAVLAPEIAVAARGGGYALITEPDEVDAVRFEQLVGAGQAALGLGEAAPAAGRFAEALALWHGRALADVTDVEPLALEAARLEELRLVAVEGRAEASIELGLHGEVIGELERLVAEYPVRERLWRLLMLALYRAERQADALAAYRRARVMLAEELGLEPGKELRELAQAVLRQEVPAAPRQERHGLPVPLTSFVGREEELAELGQLLAPARLVTLTGAGGAGKTRLAVELAARAGERFPDGVWLADLAGVTDPVLVPSRVMEALGVRQTGDLPVIEALRYRLRSAELLLVLDNCEHLLDACARLAEDLLGSSPGLRVLATSREALGVPGEAVFMVPPLGVPAESADEADFALSPAVRLFVDRASAARAAGDVATAPAGAVGRICRALDGLPLAIELAAARTSALSVAEIEQHLADKFRFLARRRPVPGARHQALKAAIDWSYQLLPTPERSFLRALSVFAGGFGLPAAAQVCGAGDEAEALDLVDSLISKSLVIAEISAAGTRYRLLETIREYAAGQLAEEGEADGVRLRHVIVYLDLAERGRDLAVLSAEHDNFRAALEWSLSRDSEIGPRLAAALGDFWLARGFQQEGQSWLERALAAAPSGGPLRADLLRLLGMVLYAAGDLERASAVLAEGIRAADAAGLRAVGARIGVLQVEIGSLATGNTPKAIAECETAIMALEAAGDLAGLADAWTVIGRMRMHSGIGPPGDEEALERAIAYARRSGNGRAELEATMWLLYIFVTRRPADVGINRGEQALAAAHGDPWNEAVIRMMFAPGYAYVGRFAEARAALASSRAQYAKSGAKFNWAIAAYPAGLIEMFAGDAAGAERELRGGYKALREVGERAYRASIAAMLADAVYSQGRLAEAQQLADEARGTAVSGDFDAQVLWRAISAKLLARRGQFPAARKLADEAMALIPEFARGSHRAQMLVTKAEVLRLAGAHQEAGDCLREALSIYTEHHGVPLAERTRSVLASLGAEPG